MPQRPVKFWCRFEIFLLTGPFFLQFLQDNHCSGRSCKITNVLADLQILQYNSFSTGILQDNHPVLPGVKLARKRNGRLRVVSKRLYGSLNIIYKN